MLQGLDRRGGWGRDPKVASHDLGDVAQLHNGGGDGMQHRARWGRFKCQACEPGNVRAMHRRPADRSLTDVRCDATFADGLGNRAGETVVAVGGSRRTHERTPMPRKERASVAVAALNPQGRDASGHFRRVRRPRWRTGREPGRPCLCEHERPVRAGKRSSHRPHCTAISRRHCGKVAAPCDVVLKRKMDNASRLRGRLCKAGESSRSSHCTAARTASRRFADSSDRARPTPDVRFRAIR